MSFLPEVREGKILPDTPKSAPPSQRLKKRRRKLRKEGTNPRRKGTNHRALGRKLWREHYENIKFISEL